MSEATPVKLRFEDRAAYRRWAEAQPRGRFEWVDGEVIAVAPERIDHVRVKGRVWRALDRAIEEAGLDCEALPDGITVEIGERTDYEPDAVVNCGDRIDGNEVAATRPVIIVEVLSPSTRSVDTGRKLADYFTLDSVRHYLMVRADTPQVVHHARDAGGTIITRILTDGELQLDPPGIFLNIADFYPPRRA